MRVVLYLKECNTTIRDCCLCFQYYLFVLFYFRAFWILIGILFGQFAVFILFHCDDCLGGEAYQLFMHFSFISTASADRFPLRSSVDRPRTLRTNTFFKHVAYLAINNTLQNLKYASEENVPTSNIHLTASDFHEVDAQFQTR